VNRERTFSGFDAWNRAFSSYHSQGLSMVG
jgi:hypothetical protein